MPIPKTLPDLPVRSALPDVGRALDANRPVVLEAPPGTGKTLLTAPFLLSSPWLAGRKIVLLEPRRLAARAAASQMAKLLGEQVGETVGYHVRLDRCVGRNTRIEILTEGLLVQRLLHDQEASDIGLVIFDEFHERNLNADFSLALALDVRSVLRPDLRILVMSATIDAEGTAEKLGNDSVVVSAQARTWPVETHYVPTSQREPIHEAMARAVRFALSNEDGGILAFLPGEGEIRRTERLLAEGGLPAGVDVYPLYGALGRNMQDAAVAPAPQGRRKVVLATSIAESSITLQGIRVVVDSGWMRVPRFSVRNGMSRLETLRVTRDRADQRRGRAGRLGPGVCYRLWDEVTDGALLPESLPEILDADLAPLRLQCAAWGVSDRLGLQWVTPPPDSAWRVAGDLLYSLGAIDKPGSITKRGKRLAGWPVHPRLAHMIDKADGFGAAHSAALLAAVVEESQSEPTLRGETDARRLYERVRGASALMGERRISPEWMSRVRKLADQWAHGRRGDSEGLDVGRMLSWAFPDRIAKSRDGAGAYRMANGHGAVVADGDSICDKWIVVAELQDTGPDGRIRLAAGLPEAAIADDFGEVMADETEVKWDRRLDKAVAVKRRKLGSLVVKESVIQDMDGVDIESAVLDGIRQHGVRNLNWDSGALNMQSRILFLRRVLGGDWPDVSFDALERDLESFIGDWLGGQTKWEQIKKISLIRPLEAYIGGRKHLLDKLAPAHWPLKNGMGAQIRYDEGDQPVIKARLQDLFGMVKTPMLADGRAPVKIFLLSPAYRQIAVTDDMESFWKTGYPLVRKEMRGRYPKHSWPEDPFGPEAMARAERRR